jgi:hypothetical protein
MTKEKQANFSNNKDSEIQIWPTMRPRAFRTNEGKEVIIPDDWVFVPAGDPGLTRRLKTSGLCYIEVRKRKNRIESVGLWTQKDRIESIKAKLDEDRATLEYVKKLEAARQKRAQEQQEYVEKFQDEVFNFLNFHAKYTNIALKLAWAVTKHATPVGSNTVARTQTIPIEQRAESAVIAWMRHQTTNYDALGPMRVKGMRFEVRRSLAKDSREILDNYRAGVDIDLETCPLANALRNSQNKSQTTNSKKDN